MKSCNPLLTTQEEIEEKNWSSEFIAALADWFDKLVKDDDNVSVFSPNTIYKEYSTGVPPTHLNMLGVLVQTLSNVVQLPQ